MDSMEGLRSRNVSLKPIITKIKREEKTDEQPLSPLARLFHEPHFNCHIIAIIGLKTRINVDVVKAGLATTLLKHPRFTSLQVIDGESKGSETQMKWVRTKVDLDNHIIVPDVDPNMESPDQFVEDYISNLTKSKLDMSKPLWDLHLLNVKTSDAEAVGIFRIHHSLGDGTSLMSLLLACTRQTANPESLPTIPTQKRKNSESFKGFFWIFMCVWSFFQLIWNTVVDSLIFMSTLVFLKDTETPIKGQIGVEFAPKRFVHRTVSLDDIKLVKNAMNTTINDVLLGVTQAGLSRYLNRRYGEGKDKGATEKNNNLPKNVLLRATLLINIRPSAGIQALADMMENDKADAKWGNLMGYVLLPFTIALRDNPLDYVRHAKATIDRKKHSLEAMYTFSSSALVVSTLGIKAAAGLMYNVITSTTMSFSNVVGPMEEIMFLGHSMAYLAPGTYGHPQSLTINFQSYVDKMTIILAVDPTVIPDPRQLLDDLEESLKLIKNAIVERG